MKSTKHLRTSIVPIVALVAFLMIGLFSRQVVSFNSRVFSSELRQQPRLYHQLNDPEYEFINSLRLAALAPNSKHQNQIVSSPLKKQQTQLFVGGTNSNKNYNEPDVDELLQQNASNRQARLQRSLSNNNDRASQLTSTKNQFQIYQDEQTFKRQLPVSIKHFFIKQQRNVVVILARLLNYCFISVSNLISLIKINEQPLNVPFVEEL